LKHMEQLARAESITTGQHVSVSTLVRRAIIDRYYYDRVSINLREVSPVETDAIRGRVALPY